MSQQRMLGVIMRAACLVGTVLLVAGCGQDGVDIDTSSDNICEEIAEVACHNAYQCCTEGEIERLLGVSEPRSEEQCREDLTIRCERSATNLQDSLDAGRVTFDAEKLNACLQALVAPDSTCSEVITDPELPWSAACEEAAFTGTVAVGGACFFDHDCAGYPGTAECAANQKCISKPTQGFPCGTGCAEGFYCATSTCQPQLAMGSPCTSSMECQDELFCDFSALMPVCTARAPGGSPCTSDSGCESGECIPGMCMGTGFQCFEDTDCGSRCADDGSSCTDASQCALGTCQMGGTTCSSDASCTAVAGDVCVFPVQCLPGDCLGDPPVCTAATLTVLYCSSSGSALDFLPIL